MTTPGQTPLPSAQNLRRQAAGATRWTSVSSAVTTIMQFAQLAVLGRLLGPRAFGLIAVVLIVVHFARIFGENGLTNALIQRKEPTHNELSTLYWTNVFFNAGAYLVILAAAPLVAQVFGQPRLGELLPVAAVAVLIFAFGAQFRALAQKALHFRVVAAADIAISAVAVTIAVSSAWFFDQGVWSLVWGQLGGAVAGTTVLAGYGLRDASRRPRLHFDRADLAGYLSFGLYRTGAMTVNFFNQRVAQLLVGALFGAQALGYYSVATNIVVQPVQRLNPMITGVAIPVFSRVQDDTERLQRGYLEMIRLLLFVSAPILIGAAVVAPTAIPLLLGQQWTEAVPLAQALAFYALFRSLGNAAGSLLLARGKANWGFYWSLAGLAIIPALVYLASMSGDVLYVALLLVVMQVLLSFVHYLVLIRNLIGPCFGSYVRAAGVPMLLAGGMGLAVLGVGEVAAGLPDAARLGAQISAGVVSYVALLWLFQRKELYNVAKLAVARS